MTNTVELKEGWQICTKLDRPRDRQGKTFYLQGSPDALGFFESIALAELEDCWIKLPAPAQRRFFGDNLFGSKSLKVSANGVVTVFWTTAFGQDWERVELRYDQSRKAFVYASEPECLWDRNNV